MRITKLIGWLMLLAMLAQLALYFIGMNGGY